MKKPKKKVLVAYSTNEKNADLWRIICTTKSPGAMLGILKRTGWRYDAISVVDDGFVGSVINLLKSGSESFVPMAAIERLIEMERTHHYAKMMPDLAELETLVAMRGVFDSNPELVDEYRKGLEERRRILVETNALMRRVDQLREDQAIANSRIADALLDIARDDRDRKLAANVVDGWHRAVVVRCDLASNTKGDEVWNIRLRLMDPPADGVTVFDRLVFNSRAVRRAESALKGLGIDVILVCAPVALIHAQAWVNIRKRNCKDRIVLEVAYDGYRQEKPES